MQKPEAVGRLLKWAVELSQFDIQYQPRTAIKGQALEDFVAEFTEPSISEPTCDEPTAETNIPTWQLFVDGSSNDQQWPNTRNSTRRVPGVNETDVLAKIATQMELLTREVMRSRVDGSSLHASVNQVNQICEHCSGQHAFGMCPFVDVNNLPMEQAQVVRSFPRSNNPYSNTYNPGWRNHPNFSWRNDQQG